VKLGRFSAGVQEVLDFLALNRYPSWHPASSSESDLHWCFLVGGPGNGKSEALRHLAGAVLDNQARMYVLQQYKPNDPVPRTVPPDWPNRAAHLVQGLEIAFINDASIPRQDALAKGQACSLFLDVSDAVIRLVTGATPVVLFANINRGVLVEEENAVNSGKIATGSVESEIASAVVRWLANPSIATSPPAAPTRLEPVVAIDAAKPYYAQCRLPLRSSGFACDVVIHAIFLDVLSLLEPVPGGTKGAIDFSSSPPTVADYSPFGTFADGGAARENTIAGGVIELLLEDKHWNDGGCRDKAGGTHCESHDFCPFAQNIRWLRDIDLRRRFLDALRAAEIAAGRRLTYRDLLGHLSLAILGEPEKSWISGTHPCRWVQEKSQQLGQGSKTAAVNLTNHRIYSNIFPSPSPARWKQSMARPRQGDTVYGPAIDRMVRGAETAQVGAFDGAFNELDPARDTDSWGGLRGQVLDVIESLDLELPSLQIARWSMLPASVHGQIEAALDTAIRDEIAIEESQGKREPSTRAKLLRKWRAALLLRQVGLALGHLAFGQALLSWLAEQENSIRSAAPLQVGKGIQNLLLRVPAGGEFMLAPFRPRTNALEDLPQNTFLVPVSANDLRVEIVARGDILTAEVQMIRPKEKRAVEVLASIVIDLAIAREAILHSTEGASSFTEIPDSAFARIERARASLIGRERMGAATVYFTSEAGVLYRIVANPVGPAPLRVLKG
jgi:hypothetical protein